MWRLACKSCDQIEGPLLFKWCLRCDFNGRVNSRNNVNVTNSCGNTVPLAILALSIMCKTISSNDAVFRLSFFIISSALYFNMSVGMRSNSDNVQRRNFGRKHALSSSLCIFSLAQHHSLESKNIREHFAN
jgi:hypothetical protein